MICKIGKREKEYVQFKRIVLATAAALLMSNGVTGVDSVVNSNSGNMYTVYAAENSYDDYVDQDDYATPAAEKMVGIMLEADGTITRTM